jgi:hypothetical protein
MVLARLQQAQDDPPTLAFHAERTTPLEAFPETMKRIN